MRKRAEESEEIWKELQSLEPMKMYLTVLTIVAQTAPPVEEEPEARSRHLSLTILQ
jgi:hypothetical protein